MGTGINTDPPDHSASGDNRQPRIGGPPIRSRYYSPGIQSELQRRNPVHRSLEEEELAFQDSSVIESEPPQSHQQPHLEAIQENPSLEELLAIESLEFAVDQEWRGNQVDTQGQGIDQSIHLEGRGVNMEELANQMAAMRTELEATKGYNANLQLELQRMGEKLTTMENSQITTAGSNRPGILKPDKFSHNENESWPNFRRRFEHCAMFNGWNGQQQKLALVSAMSDKAADVVRDLQVDDFFTIRNMLDAYEARFMPAAQSDIVRIQFDKCRQNPRESVLEYHSRLRALYRRAYPASQDDTQLIRRFAFGLANPWVQQMVLRKQAKTYDEALEAALNEAAVMDVSDALKTGASSMTNPLPSSTNLGGGEGHAEPMEIGALVGNVGNNECMFCGKPGHWKSQCQLWSKARRLLTGKRFNNRPNQAGNGNRGNARGFFGRGRGRPGGRGRGRTASSPRDTDRQRSMFRQMVAAIQSGEFSWDEEDAEEQQGVAALDEVREDQDDEEVSAEALDELVASLTDAEIDELFESGFA